ncbi:MAG: hypothetical protein Q8J74_01595 [Candidatus Didemnitutus sp.]|nr:hypothetical protein [Candidatus Didemnitutus sp.]
MSSSATLVYFIIGTPGSGRRALVLDLIENGLTPAESALVLISSMEKADVAEEKLAVRPLTEVRRWERTAPEILPECGVPPSTHVFLFADSREDTLTQIESLKPWMEQRGAELARIFCVVNCQFAEKHATLLPWFDACIHFADVVFLTQRAGVENKWLSGFIRRYEELFYPCHFLQMGKGGIANPAVVLEPQPRRVTQYFEEVDEYEGIEIGTEDDDEADEDAVDEDAIQPEIYFERNRAGRRVKEVVDPRSYFEP